MYNTDAKFEDHYFNVYDVIPFLICITQKREYLLNEKTYCKKENAIRLDSENPLK